MKKLGLLAVSLIVFCLAAPAYALNEPAVNLGFTNFLDGASRGPGWYWTEYVQIIDSENIKGPDGRDLIKDVDLRGLINLNQIIYQSSVSFWGGTPGIDIIIPLADLDIDFPLDAEDGVGDILVGPFMQWGPHTLFGRTFFHRFELQVIAPTGEHDHTEDDLNPGSDVWSINPYYTFTCFITPKLTTSLRFHYLWNSKDDHAGLLPDIQAGQAIHFNYSVAYALTDTFRLGVSGYYLNQFEDDEFDGTDRADSEEEVFAIGPGIVWQINEDLTFMGSVNFEDEAENRPEGVRSTLRLIWKFQ